MHAFIRKCQTVMDDILSDAITPDVFISTDDAIYDAFSSTLSAINSLSSKLLMKELRRLLDNKKIHENINNGIAKYIYTAGFLSIVGKEINRENMYFFMSLLGITPDYKYIDMILDMNIESHLVYIYVYYFLIASGKDVTVDNMINILEGLGLKPNRLRMAFVIKFIQKETLE